MMRGARLAALVAAGPIAAAHGAWAQSGLSRPLPVGLAVKAAQTALNACSVQGYRVSVSLVDREGVTRVLLVGDGASAISVSSSRRKAFTSAALGISTGDMQRQPPPAAGALPIDPEVLPLAGGLPIRRGREVIAAIGVGGADRSDQDEGCAQAGLDAIKDQLIGP